MILADRFSVGLDDLTRKEQGDIVKVMRVLERVKCFSVFEATENDTIARTMTKIMHGGYMKNVGGGFPWTKVELTEKGRAAIDKAMKEEGK